MFNENDIIFMRSLGIKANFLNPSDEELFEIEDKVSQKLMFSGFDANYEFTTDGIICMDILNKLP